MTRRPTPQLVHCDACGETWFSTVCKPGSLCSGVSGTVRPATDEERAAYASTYDATVEAAWADYEQLRSALEDELREARAKRDAICTAAKAALRDVR